MPHPTLQPVDVPVVLQLAFVPSATYDAIGTAIGVDGATAFRSVRRLEHARLLLPGERQVVRKAVLEFVLHAVRYVFYPVIGADGFGVPTAYSAPPLSAEFTADDALVWASMEGSIRGQTLQPLYDGAPTLPRRNPRLYQALALVDAVRAGRARERSRATEFLVALLGAAEG